MAKKKWIQKAVKREGRLKGKSAEELRATKARLSRKAKKGKLSKSERSLLGAVQLGLRFKSGEFRKRKRSSRAQVVRWG